MILNSQKKNAAAPDNMILSGNFINESQPSGTLTSIISASKTVSNKILKYFLNDLPEYDRNH